MESIKNWALDDRPREKMESHGASVLSKAELLAILVGSGVPGKSAVEMMREILNDYNDSLKLLGKATINDLIRYKGMGKAKAITVLAACQLANERLKEDLQPRQKITATKDAFLYFRPRLQDLTVEECHLMMLNNHLEIINSVMLSHGGLVGTAVDLRELLRHALLAQATSVILCHNHPSGSLRPSKHDDELTHRAADACKMMGIKFLDHLIVADNNYFSYTEQGRI
ncbi:MAG: DNA repair protein RadC [Bacteroidaceae bacterium]|nr:DNA repair protein RadC [Bacteroidaceae bacterium]